MKRKVLGIGLALSLAIIVLAIGVAPAFAQTTYVDHINAYAWGSVIPHPITYMGTPIQGVAIDAYHIDWGFTGSGDLIMIFLALSDGTLLPICSYTNSPKMYDFIVSQLLSPGPPLDYLVKPWQIQVCRIDKTVFVYWTVPLVTLAVTIPPGCEMLQGYGEAFPLVSPAIPTGNGWTVTFDMTNYLANGYFICPGWHYFGAVPPTPTAVPPLPQISVGGTETFTHP